MQGAYIIVDSGGWLIDNSEGESHVPIINCATEDFLEGFKKLSLDRDLYFSRYIETPETIEERFRGYEGEYIPEEIDWGKPAGREIF